MIRIGPASTGPALVGFAAWGLASGAGAQEPEDPPQEARAEIQKIERYALLVGHNDGGSERVTLRYAHDDAESMGAVLSQLGGVSPEREWILLDPDRAGIDEAFDAVRTALEVAEGRAEFVFYYSGHSNEEGLLLGDEQYDYLSLREMLDGLPARVRLAILDSCASGAIVRTKGGRAVAPFLVDESTQVDGFAYLTSSSADEVAQEADRIGGSYFTHYLASGLRGAADISGDGRVTLNEAYSFANAETLARTERTQHGPQHARYETQLSGTGDFVLTDLSLTSASLVLDAPLAGDAMIRDDRGVLVAELRKAEGRSIEIGLAEGRYGVTLVDGSGRFGEAQVEITAGGSVRLSPSEITWQQGESAVARGDLSPPQASLGSASPVARKHQVRVALAPGFPAPPQGKDLLLFGVAGADAIELSGVGVAGGYLSVRERSSGLALAMGSTSTGTLDGIALSMGANVAREGGTGAQWTLGANVARGPIDALQWAGGMNVATAGMRGMQVALGANYAGGESSGIQLSGVSVAKGFEGVQISLVNYGQHVRGVQLGIINVAREVSGVQLGLVNVARDVKGVPIGLVSVEKEGRHDVLLYASESDPANLELRLGGDYFYTLLGAGGALDQAYLSFGIGVHVPMSSLWLDLDALGAPYVGLGTTRVDKMTTEGPFSQPPNTIVRGRVALGFQITREFAPFVGASINLRPIVEGSNAGAAPDFMTPDGEVLVLWPGLLAGVQF